MVVLLLEKGANVNAEGWVSIGSSHRLFIKVYLTLSLYLSLFL